MSVAGMRRKFFWFMPDLRGGGKGHGVYIANEDALRAPGVIIFVAPPDKGYGFHDLPEKPQLVHDRRQGKMPRDLEALCGYMLVSERLKQLFEAVDPNGFEFVECDFTLADGSKGPQYYLGDVVRVINAVDERASNLRTYFERDHATGRDVKRYKLTGANLTFMEDIVAEARVFRTPHSIPFIFCDEVLKAACKNASITGTWFIDARKM